jgi:hypothetical protein
LHRATTTAVQRACAVPEIVDNASYMRYNTGSIAVKSQWPCSRPYTCSKGQPLGAGLEHFQTARLILIKHKFSNNSGVKLKN